MGLTAPLFAAADAKVLGLVWVALLVVTFFGAGIYVVSGRWEADRPKRDAKAIAAWEKVRHRGFWHYAARNSSIPVWLIALFARDLSRAWHETHSLRLSLTGSIETALIAVVAGSLYVIFEWRSIRHRAEEAHDRAARLQDQQTL